MEFRVQKCSNRVKKNLLDAPILGYPNDRNPYTLTTDASLTEIGAVLTQKQGTEDRVVAYASKNLSKISEINQPLCGNNLQLFILPSILKTIYLISTF